MNHSLLMSAAAALMLTACSSSETASNLPADHFDLSHWNITVPLDMDNNKKIDVVSVADIKHLLIPISFMPTPMAIWFLPRLIKL